MHAPVYTKLYFSMSNICKENQRKLLMDQTSDRSTDRETENSRAICPLFFEAGININDELYLNHVGIWGVKSRQCQCWLAIYECPAPSHRITVTDNRRSAGDEIPTGCHWWKLLTVVRCPILLLIAYSIFVKN